MLLPRSILAPPGESESCTPVNALGARPISSFTGNQLESLSACSLSVFRREVAIGAQYNFRAVPPTSVAVPRKFPLVPEECRNLKTEDDSHVARAPDRAKR